MINVGLGLAVLASLGKARWLPAGSRRPPSPSWVFWPSIRTREDLGPQLLRVFRSNQPEAFRTPEMVREAVENTDVLYYAEASTQLSVSSG